MPEPTTNTCAHSLHGVWEEGAHGPMAVFAGEGDVAPCSSLAGVGQQGCATGKDVSPLRKSRVEQEGASGR